MINNMEDFINMHPKAVLVNYDIALKFDFGMAFRTKTKTVEKFRKDNHHKYIEYPYIQPYLKLSELSEYELFIIHNKKVYELAKGNKENNFKITKELTNINYDISDDDVFYNPPKEPRIINEPICIIEE